MPFCPHCGASLADSAQTCSACGKPAGQSVGAGAAAAPAAAPAAFDQNLFGMLAYITFIPALLFLMIEPYNKNRYIRFHSLQCLFFNVAAIVIYFALTALSFIPMLGLLTLPLFFVVWAGLFVAWVILLVKAYQGQEFRLPVVGEMASKHA